MSSVFDSLEGHRAWLSTQSALPRGFRVGRAGLGFMPREVPRAARMTLTLLALDEPTPSFGALFTRNAFPGAPVKVGRRRLDEPTLGAVLINNKVSNVGAASGEGASEQLCEEAARALGLAGRQVLPCSTGVIGWRLPVEEMTAALPQVVESLQPASVLPAAEGICTTDLYPKVRRAAVGEGTIVGIAKGAGMIEPNLATMLVFLVTDLDVDREPLRQALRASCEHSFNALSIDSDTSTSDTVVLLSSRRARCESLTRFQAALSEVCDALADDVVRNGEGVHHVMRVRVQGATEAAIARGVGKAIVNSPLFQCAVNGNDANVGRLLAAAGKYLGANHAGLDLSRVTMTLGGERIFENGAFLLDPGKERRLTRHLEEAELYRSVPPPDGIHFRPPIRYPPHHRSVEVQLDLGLGAAEATVLGADRSHEYISENADYRS